jgi:anti-sigma regulatory factor (Ser/Thr protein kinase)
MPSHRTTLPADTSSCPAARKFVTERLADAPDEIRNAAGLLTSEAVTNAVLHAAGPITIDVRQQGDRYRIEVKDAGRLPPAEKHYRTDDTTGRGVQLLNRLATAWGWQPTRSGKVVWFELAHARDGSVVSSHQASPPDCDIDVAEPYPAGVQISLLGAPVRAMIRSGAHYDAMYREFRFILELDDSKRQLVPGRLLKLVEDLGSQFLGFGPSAEKTWERAVLEDREHIDLYFRLPTEAAPFVEQYEGLLEEADSYCHKTGLVTIMPTPETIAVRRWAFGEIARQCRGGNPVPWPPVSP